MALLARLRAIWFHGSDALAKGLNWPAMTMGFSVRDKTLLAKLVVGKQVQVEFRKEGPDYVVVDVR